MAGSLASKIRSVAAKFWRRRKKRVEETLRVLEQARRAQRRVRRTSSETKTVPTNLQTTAADKS